MTHALAVLFLALCVLKFLGALVRAEKTGTFEFHATFGGMVATLLALSVL